jgi:hypothetical protein
MTVPSPHLSNLGWYAPDLASTRGSRPSFLLHPLDLFKSPPRDLDKPSQLRPIVKGMAENSVWQRQLTRICAAPLPALDDDEASPI